MLKPSNYPPNVNLVEIGVEPDRNQEPEDDEEEYQLPKDFKKCSELFY